MRSTGRAPTDLAQLAITSFDAAWPPPARRAAHIASGQQFAAAHGVALPA